MMPWDIDKLSATPSYESLDEVDGIGAVYVDHEPYEGHSTRFFAYVGVPSGTEGPVPGVVCVHGGGGQAFREWVALWNKRGYAAISMDLRGNGPDGQPLPGCGSGAGSQDHLRREPAVGGHMDLPRRGGGDPVALAALLAARRRSRPHRPDRHKLGWLPDVHRRRRGQAIRLCGAGLRVRVPAVQQRRGLDEGVLPA